MLPKKCVALLCVFVLLTALTSPAFASGEITYEKTYNLDGEIMIKTIAGDDTSSAAEYKALVEGKGMLVRSERYKLDAASVAVYADSNWKADRLYPRGLTVAAAVTINEKYGGDNVNRVFAVSVKADRDAEGGLSQEFSVSDEPGAVYFAVDQWAYTEDGVMKRFIDLICPYSGAVIYEDMEVRGFAEVTDRLKPAGEAEGSGADAGTDAGAGEAAGQAVDDPAGETTGENDDAELPATILQSDHFRIEVPRDTELEHIEFPAAVSLATELVTLTGIPVVWSDAAAPAYNAAEEGEYIFAGELLLPEHIEAPGRMLIHFTVVVLAD